jgi:hypothetical protein
MGYNESVSLYNGSASLFTLSEGECYDDHIFVGILCSFVVGVPSVLMLCRWM